LFSIEEAGMEKKAVDRRIQRTRQLLQAALLSLILEKGYEAVTVQDIVDRANVGRATFYAHFQDKEALFISEFDALRVQFDETLLGQAGGNPWELILLMFRHVQGNVSLYKALTGRERGSAAAAHMNLYLLPLLREHLKPLFAGQQDVPVPQDVLAHYLVNTFLTLLMWWIDHDLPYSAERMYDMYRQLTQPGVEAIMRQLAEPAGANLADSHR
jgi:AcrR family transcriptional regulator